MSRSVVYARRAAAAVALGVLAMGCQDTSPEEAGATAGTSAPGPTATASAVPSPSPVATTAANTAEVCREVDRVIVAGSRRIATDSAASVSWDLTGEQVAEQLRRNLAELADDVRAQARRAADPEIRALIEETADQIDAGSRASRPAAWMNSTFTAIPPRLTRDCRA
ncbi:hypothetical protein GA0070606_2644 [Micromonospora citrea]|uniref:Uncharacterized protein n=1 Tax=Micromonospora citrea TaxID=47855 RepID=A0A1C6URQ5_9ACTN|nr:hypothetical protein [Micromonospora citrea]SCL56651.1 hypothetical protein GA0070606_2644 [Micromonospora citrea]